MTGQSAARSAGARTQTRLYFVSCVFAHGQRYWRDRSGNQFQWAFWLSRFPDRSWLAGFCRSLSLCSLGARFLRQVKIATAALANLNVRVVHQSRDDADGHAILYKMIQYHGLLGTADSPGSQQLLKEWQDLLAKHPEYETKPPFEIQQQAKPRRLNSQERKVVEARLAKLRSKLDEYHQGIRNDAEGYATLREMLQYHAMLDSVNSAECQQLLKEWRDLRQKHPEFKVNPPIRMQGK